MADESLRTAAKVAPLSVLDGAHNLCQILAAHLGLVVWFWAGYRLVPQTIYLAGSLLIALVHQRAMSEWIHEAAHFNLVPDKTWNDRLINLLAGVIFVNDIVDHRAGHLKHHSIDWFFGNNDPDTQLLTVSTRSEFWSHIASDLCGWTAIKMFFQPKIAARDSSQHRRLHFLMLLGGLHLIVVVLLFMAGRIETYLLYYLSLGTLYPLVNRIRVYGQHAEVGAGGFGRLAGSAASRTIDAGLLDRVFITSRVMMYHYEHHLWAGLHYRALMKISKPSADQNRFSTSRWRVIRFLYAGLK